MNEVGEYISGFPAEIQEKLSKIRSLIFETAPQVSERINWGMPSYYLNGRTLFHFAGFKKHIGFYPTAEGVTAFSEKLLDYKTAKGTVQFSLNKPLPLDLIREIIIYRVTKQ